jgi:hypothetical protein
MIISPCSTARYLNPSTVVFCRFMMPKAGRGHVHYHFTCFRVGTTLTASSIYRFLPNATLKGEEMINHGRRERGPYLAGEDPSWTP